MKFICRVDIGLPRKQVCDLFSDYEKRKNWDANFVSIEPLEGLEGKDGSVSKIIFISGNKPQELIETILENRLPDYFSATYEHKHMDNSMISRFRSLGDNLTRFEAEVEYTAFRGFLAKTLAFLFSGTFGRQVQRQLNAFKEFAESTEIKKD